MEQRERQRPKRGETNESSIGDQLQGRSREDDPDGESRSIRCDEGIAGAEVGT